MDGGSRQPRQQSGRAGGSKVKAKIKVKLCKSALLPFKKALLYAHSLKLKGVKEWWVWSKSGARPANMPSAPQVVYKHAGWQGYRHWLGTGNQVGVKHHQFLPFKKAVLYARALKLGSQKEWEMWSKSCARPANMPSTPHLVYKHVGWQGWGHWLGTGAVASKGQQFLPFKKALLYAQSLRLKTQIEWREWSKSDTRPSEIPSNPNATYKHEGWKGFGHWLGTGTVAPKDQQFLPFKKALLYARSLKLKGAKEWHAWSKNRARPANMPSRPDQVYKHGGWQGYGHWLGTGTAAPKDHQFLPFKKALLCARSLKLKSQKEWHAWSKNGARPANIPSHPQATYRHEGWRGYAHWLGTV